MSDRRTSAAACFGVVAVLGYLALRLAGAVNEPDPRTIGPTVHTGYYWRVATALWWGGLAAVGGWRWPQAGASAARALPFVVLIATIAAFVVP